MALRPQRVNCPYGQCRWEKVVFSNRSAQLAYDLHQTVCSYHKFIDSSSVEFFRCHYSEHGCPWVLWFKVGQRIPAAKTRNKHQLQCPHAPPRTLPSSRPGPQPPSRPRPSPRHGRP